MGWDSKVNTILQNKRPDLSSVDFPGSENPLLKRLQGYLNRAVETKHIRQSDIVVLSVQSL